MTITLAPEQLKVAGAADRGRQVRLRKLWKAIDGLVDFRAVVRPARHSESILGSSLSRPYVVIYEHIRWSEIVHVLRVLHGRRNVTMAMLNR